MRKRLSGGGANLSIQRRTIRQEDLSLLPASLPYETLPKETDSGRVEVIYQGEHLGAWSTRELYGKDMVLSWKDDSAGKMKAVLTVGGEEAAVAGRADSKGTNSTLTVKAAVCISTSSLMPMQEKVAQEMWRWGTVL